MSDNEHNVAKYYTKVRDLEIKLNKLREELLHTQSEIDNVINDISFYKSIIKEKGE